MKNLSPIKDDKDVVNKKYVDDSVDKCLLKSGGTMNPDSEIVIPYGTTGRAAGLGRNGVRVYTTSNGAAWASGVSFNNTQFYCDLRNLLIPLNTCRHNSTFFDIIL